jgi:carbonic anhydrase
MNQYEKLLLQNKEWSEEIREKDPDYFKRLAPSQSPKFLFIGCADSRVPATEITGTHPGDMFVHRNIANMVVHTDFNLLSVLEYAVEHLKVEHVIVCGHYGCGGVKAAIEHKSYGLLNKWLRNIKEVYRLYEDELEKMEEGGPEQVNRLVELNVIEQCNDLVKTSIIQKAWQGSNKPTVHGWVYNLEDGLIKELFNIEPDVESIHPIFRYDEM